MMADSAHEAAIEMPRRRKACKIFSYSLESPQFIRCGGRITRPERSALRALSNSDDSPQWRAERIGALVFPFRSI
jgi:hypothetical protein